MLFWEKKGPCQEACKQSSGVGKHPQMVPFQIQVFGKQTEILHFCYMCMYSLELVLDFWKKSFFDKNLDWILMD